MDASGGGRQRDDRGGRRGQQRARGKGGAKQGGAKQGGAKQGGAKQGGAKGGRPGKRRANDPRSEEVRALEGPLSQVLSRLPETQRRVVEHRMGLVDGHPATLSDTAKALGMTMHEAKQVEQRAFEHIREAIPTAHLKRLLAQLG